MRGSRLVALAAATALLGACGSGDDLKSRWLVLPEPPATLTNAGLGSPEIQDIDLLNLDFVIRGIQFLESFDKDVFPERSFAAAITPEGGYRIEFREGSATVELGEEAVTEGVANVDLSFTADDVYYSDANADGVQDAMIVLDQTVSYYSSEEDRGSDPVREVTGTGLLILGYEDGGIRTAFYVNPGPITDVSAIDAGFSVTSSDGRLSDTIEIGMPDGVPVRVDEFGGALQCTQSIDEIREAMKQDPIEVESLNPYPGVGETPGYEEFALFELPPDEHETNTLLVSGYQQVVFLLDGGDVNLWTDWRCGWVPQSEL
ncbi:hypothetical protein EJ997_07325 [Flaviflexus ciconiae]|uniref:Lipoprotein n=1 Tax=Flaviflexus ciconiae TaxID=2496867 RepID=A0A3Q9G7Y0_9ACTO|nr:hypothetical protein [Flaviflexus ciconiae]AZQ77173.1 hypothetical protein EJ997_07325 [Flaviflexus ciconiae]